jgi:hypothetical protein
MRLMKRSPTCAPFEVVEERVLAMHDGLLEGPLDEVVVQRRARLAEEEGERRPMLDEVGDGLHRAPNSARREGRRAGR